jgi:hypothetical protein
MYPLAMTLCIFCTVPAGRAPFPDVPREVGDIVYRHEVVSGTHLLRLSTTDLILDSDAWREQRLFAFATTFGLREPSNLIALAADHSPRARHRSGHQLQWRSDAFRQL